MIIDAHVKLGDDFQNRTVYAEDYLKIMDAYGIEKAVACPNKPISYQIEDGNEYIDRVLTEHKGRFLGAVRVDPWKKEKAIEELGKRFRENQQYKFIYLNPWEEQFQCNNEIVHPIVGYAEMHSIPVLIETGYPWFSHIFQVADLARTFEKVNFIATNAGQLDLSGSTLGDVAWVMEHRSNIYLGTSGACGGEWLANIEEGSPGKVVFESNYPFMEPRLEIFRVKNGFMNCAAKERILRFNIEELLAM